ncbi:MAG: hypothetical protein MUC99_10285 [Anaerolineae bacterium]|nr:hypothetical protein [Anaerolineae bacterium]
MANAEAPITTPTRAAGVRFTKVGKLYYFDFSQYPTLQTGDFVIVETVRGRQMGQVMGFAEPDADRELKPILRAATPRDLVLRQEWEAKQPEALVICREKALELGGLHDVRFHAAQYNYDGSLLTFLYSAEERANVQKLQNVLKGQFKTVIEMRQIGISLNPEEITGMCGRLRCCLVYEYEQYVEARKGLPKKGKRIGTPDGVGKVADVFPLQDMVTVYFEGEGVRPFKREDLIPLDELEALQRKAKEPCSKHGEGEACDCGQKPGERNQDKVNSRAEASAPETRAEQPRRDDPARRERRTDRREDRPQREVREPREDRPQREKRPNPNAPREGRENRPARPERADGQAQPPREPRENRPPRAARPDGQAQPPREGRVQGQAPSGQTRRERRRDKQRGTPAQPAQNTHDEGSDTP